MDFAALIYRRQTYLDGQWWLPFSAQMVHFNAAHALANLAGAVLLWSLFRPWLGWQPQVVAVAGGVLGVAMVVVWDVHCDYYAGASGALHGWAVGAASTMAIRYHRKSRTAKLVAHVLLTGVAVKLLVPHWMELTPSVWGFPVYFPAHAAGALGGLLAASIQLCSRLGHPKVSQER